MLSNSILRSTLKIYEHLKVIENHHTVNAFLQHGFLEFLQFYQMLGYEMLMISLKIA